MPTYQSSPNTEKEKNKEKVKRTTLAILVPQIPAYLLIPNSHQPPLLG